MSNKKAKGKRAKTRDLFKRRGSKMSVTSLLREFKEGDNVIIKINSSIHGGMPFRRFQNLTGKIVQKRGEGYVLKVMHGDKEKKIISTAAHLKAA